MDEFLAAQTEGGKPGTTGWWEKVLPQLTDEQKASLMEAARSDVIAHSTISTVLGRWGFQVSAPQVGHWRRTYVR